MEIINNYNTGKLVGFKPSFLFMFNFWWTAYNKSKHKLPEGFKQGNLKNTVYALGASYAIHCMAYYAQYAENDFLDSNRWDNLQISWNADGELIKNHFASLPKSSLFYYSTRYVQGAQIG